MSEEMTRKIALYCMKAYSELHSEVCEECEIYGQTGCDHCFEDALQLAIASLETDEAYQLEYEQPKFCEDCIDREAVYYYISSHIHEIITESGTDKNAHTNAILRSLANGVKTMPSVLPKVTKKDLGVDAVSRKALLDATVKKNSVWNKITNSEGDNLETIIAKLPSVTPQPRKGHWTEEFNDLEGEVRFTCSSCGNYQLFGTDFCYHCGSDNREVVEE